MVIKMIKLQADEYGNLVSEIETLHKESIEFINEYKILISRIIWGEVRYIQVFPASLRPSCHKVTPKKLDEKIWQIKKSVLTLQRFRTQD